MSTKEQNERKFSSWQDLKDGGRRYWLNVLGHSGWKARYVKEVDTREVTIRFYQEIYDENDQLVEVHDKYPVDLGHRKV
ncbi:MAG TPA: hypothetical protein DDY39_18340 [Nitrospira sp.]|nr:hypothetical protein [Nitrospira sp.]HBR50667.1 hypothetical protein [Nitrospira sp.]